MAARSAVLTLLVAIVSGPYPWAARLRGWVRDVAVAATGAAGGAGDTRTAEWVAAHRHLLMFGGAAVAAVVLLAADVSFLGLLVLAIILAAYEVLVYRAGSAASAGG
jgi:hypothetical protein